MKLSQQLPLEFDNLVTIRSFKTQCTKCKGILTAENIDAQIVRWGPHIIEIKGLANCPACSHVSKVDKKIRDDKSVYDAKKGVWVTAKDGSRRKTGKTFPSMINGKNLFVISAFLLSWQFVLIVISHNPVLARVFCFK